MITVIKKTGWITPTNNPETHYNQNLAVKTPGGMARYSLCQNRASVIGIILEKPLGMVLCPQNIFGCDRVPTFYRDRKQKTGGEFAPLPADQVALSHGVIKLADLTSLGGLTKFTPYELSSREESLAAQVAKSYSLVIIKHYNNVIEWAIGNLITPFMKNSLKSPFKQLLQRKQPTTAENGDFRFTVTTENSGQKSKDSRENGR